MMMNSAAPRDGRHMSSVFVFLLIGTYVVFSLLLVLICVRAYQSVVDATDINSQVRTSITYVANKVRAADGMVAFKQEGDYQVLNLRQGLDQEDEGYETRIYFMEDPETGKGGLYEQVAMAEDPFDPELGELVSNVNAFSMQQKGFLLELMLTESNGHENWLHLRFRTERPLFAEAY